MPIRINLLAEAQALEDMRRRDPAKRAIWAAAIVIAGVLCWSFLLWTRCFALGSTLDRYVKDSDSLAKQFTTVTENEKKLHEAQSKLAALNSYTSNRFLQASALDSLMHLPPDLVASIQIMHLRTEQNFEYLPPTKAGTSDDGRKVAAKLGASVERNKLFLDAKDTSQNPGDEQISKYVSALAATPYFKTHGITTNNIQMRITGNLMVDSDTGKPFIPFNLECTTPTFPDDMNKLGKEKRNQLILIGMGTVGTIAALWFLLISAQMQKIQQMNGKIAETEKEIAKRNQAKKEAPKVEADLAECNGRLCQIESGMPSGPPYAWVNSLLHKFNVPAYKVDMQVPGYPQPGPVVMMPDFPYAQLAVGLGGSAYYYDFGKFVADFENRFPTMRIQNIDLAPGAGGSGDDREKLAFHMDVIVLTKNDAP